ncbi:MAG TPA: ABC transporter permease [Thermoanaerobaculia bacterium]|jgi:putative ABC transport system permease protein|nr:ABC transporter permease [Thermoanaerobaculia bacterium]
MTLRLLLASLLHDPRRKLLAAGVVALGALGAGALLDLVLGARDDLARTLDAYGANVHVTAVNETFSVAELDALDKIFWRNNVVAVAPLYPLRVSLAPMGASERAGADGNDSRNRSAATADGSAGTIPGDGGAPTVVTLVGTWFDHALGSHRGGLPKVRPALPVDGRWPAEGADEVALGRRLAASLGVERGRTVAVALGERRAPLRVVGIVGGGGAEEDEALAPIEVAQRLASRPGAAREAEVFALTVPERPEGPLGARDPASLSREEYDAWYCTAYPSAVAYQIDEALPGAHAAVVREVASASSALLRRLEVGLLALAALVLAAAALGVAATLTAGILDRRRELALLAALGSERRHIVALYLGETALLGTAGGIVGGALGLLAARAVRGGLLGMAASWNPVLLPVVALAGVLAAIAGVAWPLLRTLRQPLTAAL